MVYINMRYTVADYEKWRSVYDSNEATRRAAGSSGVNQVYRDADDPNTITLVMEWDNADNARKFLDDPALREQRMKAAGVIGAPAVRAIMTRA
ncbi:MAG: cyclase [Chloroflexota bacterium]